MPLLARTLALNTLYNYSRDVFKSPKGKEHELLSICCIIKTMMGWNLVQTSTTCRERCGGMGYLAHSKFCDYIALGHAAITAEGDNRVLMTKISKDYLTNVKFNGFIVPQSQKSVSEMVSLKDVT